MRLITIIDIMTYIYVKKNRYFSVTFSADYIMSPVGIISESVIQLINLKH